MSLYSFLSDEDHDNGEPRWSMPAFRAIQKSVTPLHIYNLGEYTYVKFGWNCATYAAAVGIAKTYVKNRFDAVCIEVDRPDDPFERHFTLSFIRND